MQNTIYTNARFFDAGGARAMLVSDGTITFLGSLEEAQRQAPEAVIRDLEGGYVVPGAIDAHSHLLMMGAALGKLQLRHVENLGQLRSSLLEALQRQPDLPRLQGAGWLYSALEGQRPSAELLDGIIADRPVYLDANDLHSCWVNSAALREMGIDDATPDPIGGAIERDPATGRATGLLEETAVQQYVWSTLERLTHDSERDLQLGAAIDAYLAQGVIGAVDMAVGEAELSSMRRVLAPGAPRAGFKVAAHWLIHRRATDEQNVEQVRQALELARADMPPGLRIVGIKLIVDGVIDGCTAAMCRPFADGSHPEPIWDEASLVPVLAAADAAGLQIAMHAIGDKASDIALNALEEAFRLNGERPRRHRLEHLEVVSERNVRRLAQLSLVASVQPVHADPAIQAQWRRNLGDERVERGYPWGELREAGARLAVGSDAPTAPYELWPNLYVASTRRSALRPELPANLPASAVPLADALRHASADAAYSCGWEHLTGRLAVGLQADFAVLPRDPFAVEERDLLGMVPLLTVVSGRERYRDEERVPAEAGRISSE